VPFGDGVHSYAAGWDNRTWAHRLVRADFSSPIIARAPFWGYARRSGACLIRGGERRVAWRSPSALQPSRVRRPAVIGVNQTLERATELEAAPTKRTKGGSRRRLYMTLRCRQAVAMRGIFRLALGRVLYGRQSIRVRHAVSQNHLCRCDNNCGVVAVTLVAVFESRLAKAAVSRLSTGSRALRGSPAVSSRSGCRRLLLATIQRSEPAHDRSPGYGHEYKGTISTGGTIFNLETASA
jgi:hypothetical protein